MSAVHGRCDERFAAIKALAENLAVEDDDGFALAVEVDGELVVDLWAGGASEASPIYTFSTVMLNDPSFISIAAGANARTLWYSLYDLTERTVEIDFYLNSHVSPSGDYSETRSDPFNVTVPSMAPTAR